MIKFATTEMTTRCRDNSELQTLALSPTSPVDSDLSSTSLIHHTPKSLKLLKKQHLDRSHEKKSNKMPALVLQPSNDMNIIVEGKCAKNFSFDVKSMVDTGGSQRQKKLIKKHQNESLDLIHEPATRMNDTNQEIQAKQKASVKGHPKMLTTISSMDQTVVNTQGSENEAHTDEFPRRNESKSLTFPGDSSRCSTQSDRDKHSSDSSSFDVDFSTKNMITNKIEYSSVPNDEELLPAVTVHNFAHDPQSVYLHSLKSNITLNIKPDAIRGCSEKPNTCASSESMTNISNRTEALKYHESVSSMSAESKEPMKTLYETPKETRINMEKPSPTSSNIQSEKPTSFLTRLISISRDQTGLSTTDAFKYLSGYQNSKSKKKKFDSMVALAGSNSDSGSISDRNSSSLSNKSHMENEEKKNYTSERINLRKETSFYGTDLNSVPLVHHKLNSCSFSDHNNICEVEEPSQLVNTSKSNLADDIDSMKELSVDNEDWFNAANKISETWSKGCFMDEIRNEISHEKFIETPVGKSGIGISNIKRPRNSRDSDIVKTYDTEYETQARTQKLLQSKLNLHTPELSNTRLKKYCSSISSNNSTNICSTTAVNKSHNVSTLHKMLHHRGLVRPRPFKKPSSVIEPNIDDAGAVREIEAGLLNLMEQFEAGNLTAFGKDSRLRQMELIREQQESLMKLHLDISFNQDLHQPLSEKGLSSNSEQMTTLMEKLACVSKAIDKLQDNTNSAERERHLTKEVGIPRFKIDSETVLENDFNSSLNPDEGKENTVVLRSKSSMLLNSKKSEEINRRSIDLSSRSIMENHTSENIMSTARKTLNGANITENIDYETVGVQNSKVSGLNVVPLSNLRNIATDGQNSYVVDNPKIRPNMMQPPHNRSISSEKEDSRSKQKKSYKNKNDMIRKIEETELKSMNIEQTEASQTREAKLLLETPMDTKQKKGREKSPRRTMKEQRCKFSESSSPSLPLSNAPPLHKRSASRAAPSVPPPLPARPAISKR